MLSPRNQTSLTHNENPNRSLSSSSRECHATTDQALINSSDSITSKIKSNPGYLKLEEIRRKYDIPPDKIELLKLLQEFEIVIVGDDSTSMKKKIDGTEHTRWDEARDIVKIVLDISVMFDKNGVDIYFLNRDEFLAVKDPSIIDELFAEEPSGYTPLIRTLEKIFQSKFAHRNREKKLLVFVATDGLPTNDDGDLVIEEFENLMNNVRDPETTYVNFLLCTDDQETVERFRDWDRTMKHVDVTDDIETETEEVHRHSGFDHRFSRGDYVIKALIGSIHRPTDTENEPQQVN